MDIMPMRELIETKAIAFGFELKNRFGKDLY